MIGRNEIQLAATELDVRPTDIERDYLFGWMLSGCTESSSRPLGLSNVSIDTTQRERLELRFGQELWDWCLGSNPIPGMLVSDLTDQEKAAMLARLDESIGERAKDQGYAVLTAPLNIGIGTK